MNAKARILIAILTVALIFSLISRPGSLVVPVGAQSASPRQDLVSRMRLDVDQFQNAMEDFQVAAHIKAQGNITFVAGDMVGNNSGVAAADLTQAVTDFTTIYTDVTAGGTISIGVWTNVQKIR